MSSNARPDVLGTEWGWRCDRRPRRERCCVCPNTAAPRWRALQAGRASELVGAFVHVFVDVLIETFGGTDHVDETSAPVRHPLIVAPRRADLGGTSPAAQENVFPKESLQAECLGTAAVSHKNWGPECPRDRSRCRWPHERVPSLRPMWIAGERGQACRSPAPWRGHWSSALGSPWATPSAMPGGCRQPPRVSAPGGRTYSTRRLNCTASSCRIAPWGRCGNKTSTTYCCERPSRRGARCAVDVGPGHEKEQTWKVRGWWPCASVASLHPGQA